SGEPIGRSSHVRHQSLSAALDDRQQIPTITTTSPSLRATITTTTTSSPDTQSLNNKRHNDSDYDIVLIGRVPAPKRPARYRSAVDIKPSLIDSIPLVPEIVNKPPVETITLIDAIPMGPEMVNQSPIDIMPVINTSPPEPSIVHNPTLTTTGVQIDIILDSTSGHSSDAREGSDGTDGAPIADNTNTTYGCLETGCRRRFADRPLMYQHMRAVHSSQGFPSWTARTPVPSTVQNPSITRSGAEIEIITLDSEPDVRPAGGTRTAHSTGTSLSGWYACLMSGCDKTFADRIVMYQHMRVVHSTDQFADWTAATAAPGGPPPVANTNGSPSMNPIEFAPRCLTCNKSFELLAIYDEHMRTDHPYSWSAPPQLL
ncbi:unnamed protein product, partial [Medioppia subpectinata]